VDPSRRQQAVLRRAVEPARELPHELDLAAGGVEVEDQRLVSFGFSVIAGAL